jgi:hypothetical protein
MADETVTNTVPADTGAAGTAPAWHGELVSLLLRKRHLLLAVYILLFAGFVITLAAVGVDACIPVFHALLLAVRGDANPWSVVRTDEALDWLSLLVFLGGFCLLQAGFLWGGGRIAVARTRPKWYRYILSSIIVGVIAGLLALAAGLLFLQYIMNEPLDDGAEPFLYGLLVVVALTWLVWFVLAILLFRRHGQFGALSRLAGALLAGS